MAGHEGGFGSAFWKQAQHQGPHRGKTCCDDCNAGFDGCPNDGSVHGPCEIWVMYFELCDEADKTCDDGASH